MFFPCTTGETVQVYNTEADIEQPKYQPHYLSKPTVIMCNPNALFYQLMVNATNAYWLNFFLKREINVMCWNYRGYGESKKSSFTTLNPATSKLDSEYVMHFLLNKLQIKGKVGVYGRSIGGITACHLASKFSDLVEVLIVDRTLSELQGVAEHKLKGRATTYFFDLYTNGWKCQNALNFTKANNTYKIVMCDPLDDTIDQFNGLMAGAACQQSKGNYDTEEYKLFYESLLYVCDYEERLFKKLDESARDRLEYEMVPAVKRVEEQFSLRQESIENYEPPIDEERDRLSKS